MTPLLQVRGIGKAWPGVQALQNVELTLQRGEVLGLIGENGAGKSTLMKVLAGAVRPDGGQILLDGGPVQIESPRHAASLGIALIHQELSLCDNLTVTGALYLGQELRVGPFLRERTMRMLARTFLQRLGLDVPPTRLVGELSPGQKQLLEIARALRSGARILIMDEPTSSLTTAESERLFGLVDELRKSGVAIIYISHRLGEITRLCDRVVALRDGRNAGQLAGGEADHDNMVALMVGRRLVARRRVAERVGGELLTVRNLRTRTWPGAPVNLNLRAGEVVGIAGLLGAGRSELLRALFGADRALAGEIRVQNRVLEGHRPADAIACGLVLVPEDRKLQGLVLGMSVRENLSLAVLRRRGRLLARAFERELARKSIGELGIATPGPEQQAGLLSGGNQQKIVLGKWLACQPRVLLLDEPTRGIDVAARQEIYARIDQLAKLGMAVLFASSEMEELFALADRIVVMHEGRIAGEVAAAEFGEQRLLQLMTGRGAA